MNILSLIGRQKELFVGDIQNHEVLINDIVRSSRFLVIGAAGSIGQAVCKEIFKRSPDCLHAIDISENNLVELVRQLRALVDILMVNLKPLLWIVEVRNTHH